MKSAEDWMLYFGSHPTSLANQVKHGTLACFIIQRYCRS